MAKKRTYTEAEMREMLQGRVERAEERAEHADEVEEETRALIPAARERERAAARGFRWARRRSLRTALRVLLWICLVSFALICLAGAKVRRVALEARLERAKRQSRRHWSAKHVAEERLETFEAEVRRRYRRRAEKLGTRYDRPALIAGRHPENAKELGLLREWLAGAAAREEAYRLADRYATPEEARAMRARLEEHPFKRYEREISRSESTGIRRARAA